MTDKYREWLKEQIKEREEAVKKHSEQRNEKMYHWNQGMLCAYQYSSQEYSRVKIDEEFDLKGKYELSDGYHTFDELYYHRMILFSIICNQNKEHAWKSWLHADGTMYEDYFIVGITTHEGDYTYHYHKDFWDKFKVLELERGHEWDGHQPEDIWRLESLLKT